MQRISMFPLIVLATVLGLFHVSQLTPARADESEKAEEPILELRILANSKHDQNAIAKAKTTDVKSPPKGYRWVTFGDLVIGKSPAFAEKSLTVKDATWKPNAFGGSTVECRGKNLGAKEFTRKFAIVSNTADTLNLSESPKLYFQAIETYRIDTQPDHVRVENFTIREEPVGPDMVRRWVLLKLDPQDVTEKDLKTVYRTADEQVRPAIGFQFSRDGGKKFGALTRAHLPEEGGAFKYHLGIIIDGKLISAPVILQEINDRGIIENFEPGQVDPLIERMKASIAAKKP